jgi:serine/threonine protein kinase
MHILLQLSRLAVCRTCCKAYALLCISVHMQEFMSGGTLKQLVTRQMLSNGGRVYSLVDGLDICLQMARGLKYLHSCSPMVSRAANVTCYQHVT